MKSTKMLSMVVALATFIVVVPEDCCLAQAKAQPNAIRTNAPYVAQFKQEGRHSQTRKNAAARFDVRRLKEQAKMLERIEESRLVNRRIQQTRRQSIQFEKRGTAPETIPVKKATLLGRPTKFVEAPALNPSMIPSKRASVSSANPLVNGKAQDTVFIGEPLTLTFSFAPNAVSATLTILLDGNTNGVADSSDVPLADILLMDNDETDGNTESGLYSLDLQNYFGSIIGDFIFELNDYQTISSTLVAIRQKPTSKLLLGTISPPFPNMAVQVVSSPTYVVVFSDTAGHFSCYVDPGSSSTISVYGPYDQSGVSNGYIPPPSHVISLTSDTTKVSLVLTQATAFVEGYVRDQTGTGVIGATVWASGSAFYMLTRTDVNGYYKVGVSAGSWYAEVHQVQSSEYLEISPTYRYIQVPANTTVQQDFRLAHANSTISGKVTLSAQGVGGVLVYTYSDSLSNAVLTSAGGTYSLPVYSSSVATLKYTVMASMQDVEGYYFVTPLRSNIAPGAVDVDFAVTKVAGGIKGRVTDEGTGAPIVNAQIVISGMNYKSIVSNDSGYYKASLLDGTYSMTVNADRYYSYSSPTFTIAGSVLTRNIALWRSGTISGKVTDTQGNPISNAEVSVYDTSAYFRGYSYTDLSGNFVVSGLLTSDYKVECRKTGYVDTWYNEATQWYQAMSVHVNDGFDTPNIDFVISRGGSISGNVKDRSGNPISNAYVEILDSTLYYYITYAVTDDSGNYTATGLVTGDYFVKTYTELYFDQWYNNADSPDKATKVRVVINQNTPNINFVLFQGGTLSGRVTTKQHTAIPYASINVLDSTFFGIAYGYTDDSGSYVVNKLKPGIKLTIYAYAYGYGNKWYNNVSSPDSATPVVLQEGEIRNDINFVLPLPSTISGRVRDVLGNPISYSYVYAVDKSGNYVGYGYADYQGVYQMTNLSAGSYFATAYDYYHEQQWYDHKRTMQDADAINVVEEQTTSNINFDLLPPPGPGNTVTISEARKDTDGDLIPDYSISQQLIAVSGIVTTPNLQAGIAQTSYFIQDSTAGINVFYPGWSLTAFEIGDSVIVIGAINQYRGQTELMPRSLNSDDFTVLKHHAAVPRPTRLTLHQYVANAESYEGRLIRLDSLYKSSGTWPALGSNGNLYLVNSSKSDTIRMFIDLDTNIDGSTEPVYPISVLGVACQFSSGSALDDGYQILPRSVSDVGNVLDVSDVERTTSTVPDCFELYANYPNPFNPSTTIAFDLPKASSVSLEVFNLLGQKVASIVSGNLQAGRYRYNFDAGRLASGVYIYQLRAGDYIQTRKMVLMK